MLSGTKEKNLDDVKKKCVQAGLANDDVLCLPFDLTDLSGHAKQLDKVLKHFKRLDVLVNNAGRSQRAMFHETSIEVDQQIFLVNVFSTINLSRLVLNYWRSSKTKGHFVVTSSTAGKTGIYNGSSYSATKFALHGYFESIRNESHERGIRVTIACPGPTLTQAADRAFTASLNETFGAKHTQEMKRMSAGRCANLIAVAIVNEIDEAWICFQPILFLYYFVQYLPSISRWVLPRFLTGERMAKLREGKQ